MCSDPTTFSFEPNDHHANNIQKLNDCIDQYLEGVLEVPLEKDYVCIQEITKEKENTNLLRLVTVL